MKKVQKFGICCIIFGIILLALLVGIGAYVKMTLEKAPLSLQEFEVGDDNQHCSISPSYYYFWNLTNLAGTLTGEKASYNLVGPYVFDSHSCTIDEEITSATVLAYRNYDKGTFFNEKESTGSMYDRITGANLAYVTVLKQTQGESGLLVAISGPGLQTVIETMQNSSFIQQVIVGAIPQTLLGIQTQTMQEMFVPLASAGISTQVLFGVIGTDNTTLFSYFNDPSFALTSPVALQGFANWLTAIGMTPINVPDDVAYTLYHGWLASQGSNMFMFAMDPEAAGTALGISEELATQLRTYFGGYLMQPTTFNNAVALEVADDLFYTQWANGTIYPPGVLSLSGLSGFEAGIPDATEITGTVAKQLWDTTSNYSLTTTKGITLWFGALSGSAEAQAALAQVYPIPQLPALMAWLGAFYAGPAPELLKSNFGITDFSDLAYAQWGGLVLGQSLKDLGGLDFYPEIAAVDPSIHFSAAQAKALLNGTYPLFEAENIGALLTLVQSGSFSTVQTMFGINTTQAISVATYLQYIMQNLAAPIVQGAFAEGSGLFVTRTVQEWLFTATDPLLVVLQQKSASASIDSNTTDDLAAVRARPKSTRRIYTKDGSLDDLHASLMKQSTNPVVSSYAENITITGYTGTQYMPFNDIDKPAYPLELWLGQISRPVPLKNAGKSDYKGVEVSHVLISNDALKSSSQDPQLAKFYQGITGMWNITALPPNAPVFISRVDFAGADASVTENVILNDDITGDTLDVTNEKSTSIKGQWFQVEPFLGTTINANVAIQLNVQIDNSALDVFHSNVRGMFAPIFWGRITGQATENDVNMIKGTLYSARLIWQALVGVGVALGVVLFVAGIIMYKKGGKKTKVVRLQ